MTISPDRILSDPLSDCRQRGHGVGFVGPDIPVEVLLGTDRPFAHLPWRRHEQADWANQWLESGFPYWARSILEQWHAGAFDDLETIVFSRADDASQRLYYYVRELQRRGKLRGPSLLIFDVAHVARQTSLMHTAAAVRALMQALDVSRKQLLTGIRKAAQLRQRLAAIEHQRQSHGAFYEQLARAVLWSDPTQWLEQVELPAANVGGQRVLLAGSMPPDDRIHRSAEAAGASVVAEAHALGPMREVSAGAADRSEPEHALARRIRERSVAPRAFFDRAGWLVGRARAAAVQRVVVWLTAEDEALAWPVPAQRAMLAAAGIPALFLTAADWRGEDGALERIATFCREGADATA